MFRAAGLAVLVLAASVASADDTATPSRREKGDLAIKARAVLRKYCYECHGGAATRGTVAVLDYPKLTAAGPNPVPFVAPKDAAGSQVVQFIEDGSMPPGGRPRPTREEIDTLKAWVAADAPSYPAAFGDRTTLEVMLRDLDARPADAPHLRYLSLAHLVREDAPPDLKTAEDKLFKALARCGVATPPEPVDGTATLFRLDLRTAKWDSRELFVRPGQGAADALHPLTIYDLLLLEYPHAVVIPDGPTARRLGDYFAKARLARPVPFLRADWVAERLAAGSPLADDVRSLVELTAALEKQKFPPPGRERDMPCGPEPRPFGARDPVPAAKADSAAVPPDSWYAGDRVPAPPPLKLTVEVIDLESKAVTAVKTGAPFRLRVGTDRDAHFVLLLVRSDGTTRIQPTNKKGLLKFGESILTPEGEGAFVIGDLLPVGPKATDYFVLFASTGELPMPTVVRSRHARTAECAGQKRFPVSRFLFEPDAKPDPARVVRRVVPIVVTEK